MRVVNCMLISLYYSVPVENSVASEDGGTFLPSNVKPILTDDTNQLMMRRAPFQTNRGYMYTHDRSPYAPKSELQSKRRPKYYGKH
jgi:hypothetical protein